jgi:hypothetical protein
VLASYHDWGSLGEAVFGLRLIGETPWVNWFTEGAKWVAVILTFFSGWVYLWKNRALYLSDL